MNRDFEILTQRVKEAVSLFDVVREAGIELNAQGFGCCPFHGEKTPSFHVKEDFFKCFGCGESGDVISFVMLREGMEFWPAVKELAQRAGVALPMLSKEQKAEAELENRRRDVLTELAEHWHKNCPGPVREWAIARWGEKVFEQEKIGFASNQTRDLNPLSSSGGGFASNQTRDLNPLSSSGGGVASSQTRDLNPLSISGGGVASSQTRDLNPLSISVGELERFNILAKDDQGKTRVPHRLNGCLSGRVIIPDWQGGRVRFLWTRAAPDAPAYDTRPKYLPYAATGEAPLINEAQGLRRQAKDGKNEVWIVEGVSKVLTMKKLEIPNVVGIPGVGTLMKHFEKFSKVERIWTLLDLDDAGRMFQWKYAKEFGARMRVVELDKLETHKNAEDKK